MKDKIGTNKEGFFKTLTRFSGEAIRNLRNKPKEAVKKEKFRRTQLLKNIRSIEEKLEGIRSQLGLNAQKLEFMAQNSAKQYGNTQLQIIALAEFQKRLESEQQDNSTEYNFEKLSQKLQDQGVIRKITRKIENLKGVSITAATKAIMARLLSQHNEELASDYEQDITTLIPELKGIIVTAEANDTTIQAIDTRNGFVKQMNNILRNESGRSREAINKIQAISNGSAIDVETARTLTANVLEVVKSVKKVQEDGRPTNKAFEEILTEFRQGLLEEVGVKQPKGIGTKVVEGKELGGD